MGLKRRVAGGCERAWYAGLISSAQAVEHYEVARYGTLKSWAALLDYNDAVALFDANLQEELATDLKLTQLGEATANPKGAKKKVA